MILAAAAALLAFTLAACGSDEPTTSTPGGSGGPAATAGGDTPTAAAGGDCGSAADAIKSAITSTAVSKVDVVGQCTTATITTTLGEGDGAAAKEICEAAAKVAYTGDINSIRVTSAAGTELSQGISGAPCLG